MLWNHQVLLSEVPIFSKAVYSIKKTNVTHKVAIQEIRSAGIVLNNVGLTPVAKRDGLSEFVKHLKSTREGAREGSMIDVDAQLLRLGDELVHKVTDARIFKHTNSNTGSFACAVLPHPLHVIVLSV